MSEMQSRLDAHVDDDGNVVIRLRNLDEEQGTELTLSPDEARTLAAGLLELAGSDRGRS